MLDHIKKSPYTLPACLAALICISLYLAGLYARPLFPVDETRYVTVAWEMHQSGNWILPSLNHEAYHHKPPVLFWLINALWGMFGVSQGAAMAVPYLAAFAFLMLTARLSTRLFPQNPNAPLLATALLAGSLPFVIYANLIMFDLLLGVFALLGLTAIWDYIATRKPVHLLLLALAIGLGVLTKGPVILLHVGTVLLLTRYWAKPDSASLKKIILPIGGSILLGAAIALSWAIPAAIEGGKEFADKIFWGQTAGRMVKAFDHQRPIYWYLTFVPLFVLPWIASPALWTGIKRFKQNAKTDPDTRRNFRFLLSWGLPVFIAFSFISGKQVHYLVPVVPCISLFFTAAFLNISETLRKKDWIPVIIVTLILSSLPIMMKILAPFVAANIDGNIHLEDAFGNTSLIPSIVILVMIIAMSFSSRNLKTRSLITISLAMMLMMSGFQLAARTGFFMNYDLVPLATELQKIDAATTGEKRPLAYVRNYHGEFGFLARLDRPVKQILPEDVDSWFVEHPNGLVFFRTKNTDEYAKYHALTTMPYKLGSGYALVEQNVEQNVEKNVEQK